MVQLLPEGTTITEDEVEPEMSPLRAPSSPVGAFHFEHTPQESMQQAHADEEVFLSQFPYPSTDASRRSHVDTELNTIPEEEQSTTSENSSTFSRTPTSNKHKTVVPEARKKCEIPQNVDNSEINSGRLVLEHSSGTDPQVNSLNILPRSRGLIGLIISLLHLK